MTCFLRILLLVFWVSGAGTAWAGDVPEKEIGFIKTLRGRATIERDGKKRPASIEQGIWVNDIIRTDKTAAMGIVLKDNTMLSIGPGSELAIDEYVYVPKDRKLSMLTRMVKGTVEYIAGTIGKLAPKSIRFETPMAILGVRGTRFLVKID